eukprot:1117713_1
MINAHAFLEYVGTQYFIRRFPQQNFVSPMFHILVIILNNITIYVKCHSQMVIRCGLDPLHVNQWNILKELFKLIMTRCESPQVILSFVNGIHFVSHYTFCNQMTCIGVPNVFVLLFPIVYILILSATSLRKKKKKGRA